MTLDATVGGVNANAFIDVATADAYHEERLFNSEYTSATTTQKEAAIIWATKLLDRLNWLGEKAEAAQALRFPRSGLIDLDGYGIDNNIIPVFLKNATAELALALLKGDRTSDPETAGFKRIKVDTIELEIDKLDRANSIPDTVMGVISPYLDAPGYKVQRA